MSDRLTDFVAMRVGVAIGTISEIHQIDTPQLTAGLFSFLGAGAFVQAWQAKAISREEMLALTKDWTIAAFAGGLASQFPAMSKGDELEARDIFVSFGAGVEELLEESPGSALDMAILAPWVRAQPFFGALKGSVPAEKLAESFAAAAVDISIRLREFLAAEGDRKVAH